MKKLSKQILGMTSVGLLSGVGATVVGKTGGSAAGFTAVGDMMGPLGTVIGAGAVMRQTKKLRIK